MNPCAHLPATTAEAIELLRSDVAGDLLTPCDADYASARRTGAAPPARPVVIVLAESTADVVEAVRFARAQHLPVAIRSQGQRVGEAADGAVLVDLARLDSVSVDEACRTATVGAGATWAMVIEQAARHGLAPVVGEWSQRSAVSDTLCGGMGWLARRQGLACDSVVSFQLVTPDGLVVEVSADAQPELFWALSGAGDGSLGVVVSIEIELQPSAPLYAGRLVYPASLAGEVLRRWRTWITGARPELTSAVVVTGDTVAVHGCWSGAVAVGIELLGEWRLWRTPDLDDWQQRPLADIDDVCDARLARPETMTNEWVNTLRDELLDELAALPAGGRGRSAGIVEVRFLGGVARARSASAANGRSRTDQFLLTLAGYDDSSEHVRAGLQPYVTGAVYLDHTDPAERTARTRAAFGAEQWNRLCAVKVALDPHDRFRHGLVIAA